MVVGDENICDNMCECVSKIRYLLLLSNITQPLQI